MTNGLRIGFLMDPLEGVRVDHDTTFLLMRAAQARGHRVCAFEQRHLGFRGDRAVARVRWVHTQNVQGAHFRLVSEQEEQLSSLDAIFLRKDPPVDADFLHATQLLELNGGERGPFLVNSPSGLREANEKLFALHFSRFMPRTLVSADMDAMRAFVEEEGEAILKPVDGFAGRGIVMLREGDRNVTPLLEMATLHGTTHAMLQAYLPASREGDKRILLLDGEPLGSVLRVPRADDVRANMAAGGSAAKTSLTKRELELIAALKPILIAKGLHFVGIDVIGDHLTEVNVTSPTGAAEVDALDGVDTGAAVMRWLEERVQARAG